MKKAEDWAVVIVFFIGSAAFADPSLPYPIRTQHYSGFGTTIRGDIRAVGMSGATVGLADSFIAALDNPAGLAMTLNNADLNYTSNWVNDGEIQQYDQSINTQNFGLAMSQYPWGFSMGYTTPYREGQNYVLPGATTSTPLSVTYKEFEISVAHLFFENHLSLGASLVLGQSDVEAGSTVNSSYEFSATFGAMVHLQNHVLLSASYSPPMHLGGGDQQISSVQNFFQPMDVPARLGLGAGWIPNRFFRTDLTMDIFGATGGTALLRDDTALIGQKVTFQPRLGASYQFADFKEFQSTLFGGTYFETTRIQGNSGGADRPHITGSVEIKPWVFLIGLGFDRAYEYKNTLVGVSVDLIRILEKLDLIPYAYRPPREGWFPRIQHLSDAGLPRPLVKYWIPQGPDMNPIKVGLEIPKKVEAKIQAAAEKIKKIVSPSKPKKRTKKKKKKRKSKSTQTL